MTVSAIGLAALKAREGVRLSAYKDSVGVWTIGWGHTLGVKPGDRITQAQAEAFLEQDIHTHAAPILSAIKVPVADHEADALVSIAFNIGVGGFKRSAFLKRLNAGDRAGCAAAIMQWLKPPELLSRRTAERDQFLTPYSVRLPKARSDDRSPVKVGSMASPAPRKPASDRTSIPAGQWAEDMLTPIEIEAYQKRLRALGYWQVGKVDGKIGPSFRAALTALQTTAGITIDGRWGPETRSALNDDANRRVVDEARANTTAKDLRKQGSTIAIKGNRSWWMSILGLVGSLGMAAYTAYQAPADLPFGSALVLGFLPGWVAALLPYAIAFFPLAYAALQAHGMVEARVIAERTGLHNGEPDPAPSPPVTAPSDTPHSGGLFGGLFVR